MTKNVLTYSFCVKFFLKVSLLFCVGCVSSLIFIHTGCLTHRTIIVVDTMLESCTTMKVQSCLLNGMFKESIEHNPVISITVTNNIVNE